MRRTLTLCLLATCFSVTGCLELMQGYTLNPDGSGKVVLDTTTPAPNQFAPDAANLKPEDMIKQTIEEQVKKAKGVEAWSDITCEMTKEGKIHFRGTAYFSDVNKLDANDSSGGGTLSWKKEGDAMVLLMQSEKEEDAADPQPIPDAQVEEQLKQEKAQYQQMKPLMIGMLTGMKVQISVTVPGKIADAKLFQVKDQTASLAITGQQMMDAMDKVYANDDLLRAKIKAGKGKGETDMMFEQIFGKKGPASVKVTGANQPQFDYKAEVAKAKAAEAAMFKKLGVTPPAKQ